MWFSWILYRRDWPLLSSVVYFQFLSPAYDSGYFLVVSYPSDNKAQHYLSFFRLDRVDYILQSLQECFIA